MIGHGVLVEGSSIDLASSKAILGVDLSSDASSVKLTVKDSTGKAVYTMNLGAQKAGVLPLAWDGSTDSGTTAVDGKYTFEVTAAKGDQAVTVSPLSFGEVTSVSSGTSGLSLNVPSIGSVKLSEIRQIL
jgi:flagellar basal-body rod modification protein FlgD